MSQGQLFGVRFHCGCTGMRSHPLRTCSRSERAAVIPQCVLLTRKGHGALQEPTPKKGTHAASMSAFSPAEEYQAYRIDLLGHCQDVGGLWTVFSSADTHARG